MELIDLFAEGSVNLVVADFGNIMLMPKLQAKLKVFKGTLRVCWFSRAQICLFRIFLAEREQSVGSALRHGRVLHGQPTTAHSR